MNPSTAWKELLRLQDLGEIFIKSDNKKSLVTVIGWEKLHLPSKKVTTKGQQNNNKITQVIKEIKEIKETKSTLPAPSETGGVKEKKKPPGKGDGRVSRLDKKYRELYKTKKGLTCSTGFGTSGQIMKDLLAVLDHDYPGDQEAVEKRFENLLKFFFWTDEEHLHKGTYKLTLFRYFFDDLRGGYEKQCRKRRIDEVTLQPLPPRSEEENRRVKELAGRLAGPEVNDG